MCRGEEGACPSEGTDLAGVEREARERSPTSVRASGRYAVHFNSESPAGRGRWAATGQRDRGGQLP